MKKRGRSKKRKNCQGIFRKTEYSFDQYWNINYTAVYEDGVEKDLKTFIKSNSYKNAKKILKEKLSEKNIRTKSVQGFMFHSKYKGVKNRKLTFENWEQIKSASFPNENDYLFTFEIPRPEGYTNRFNKTDYNHLKAIGFKSGAESYSTIHRKGKHLPLEKRMGKKWTGAKWVEWDKREMAVAESNIKKALSECDNNRYKAAIYLNMGRTQLYKLMKRTKGLDWWNKEFPIKRSPPPRVSKEERSATQSKVMKRMMNEGYIPFGNLTEEQQEKKIKNIRISKKKQTLKRFNYWIPKIKEALEKSSNKRVEAAKYLEIKSSHFRKLIQETKHIVNWSEKYPSPFYNYSRK